MLKAIDDRVDELVALTVDLIRFPTVNPPGEAYTPCAEYLGARLKKRGFGVEFVRGEGAPGDSDRYPAHQRDRPFRRPRPGTDGALQLAYRRRRGRRRLERRPVRRHRPRRPRLRPRRLRHERRARRLDHRGGSLHGRLSGFSRRASRFPARPTRSPAASAASRYLARLGYFSKPRVDHVIIPEPLNKDRICLGHRGVWWAEIETKGEIAHGSMPFLGDCAIRHMGAVLEAFERGAFPGARPQADAHAGGAGRRAALDHEHQFDPWRPDRGFPTRPALAQRAGFLPAYASTAASCSKKTLRT